MWVYNLVRSHRGPVLDVMLVLDIVLRVLMIFKQEPYISVLRESLRIT